MSFFSLSYKVKYRQGDQTPDDACYMTPDNRLWILMSRRLSGEASPAEWEELQHLLQQSPEKQYLLSILHSYFEAIPGPAVQTDTDLEEKLNRILALSEARPPDRDPWNSDPSPQASEPPVPVRTIRPWQKITGYAAAAIVVLLLGRMAYRLSQTASLSSPSSRTEEILARAGTRTKLILPDGTQVWLNSNSKLKYSDDYAAHTREVNLEGEAYFDVVKDVQHPFIVHASSLDIKVLGTAFVIKSYPQEETVETTLLRGSIEVTRKDNPGTARVILKPNEKLVFSKRLPALAATGHPVSPAGLQPPAIPEAIAVNSIRRDVPDSDKVETAWMYNRLVFQGDSFKELAAKMERWYNIKIVFRDESLDGYRFGGALANETVDQAFKALQFTAEFGYTIRGNEVELYAKNNKR